MTVATPTLTVTRCPVPTAAAVALDDGLLAEALRPLGVEVAELPRGGRGDGAHFDHDATHLLREGGNVPALWARSRGADTRLVGLTWTEEYQAIVALPGRLNTLGGAHLGIVRDRSRPIDHYAAMALRGHHAALRALGLRPSDATIVELDVPLAAAAASEGAGHVPLQWRRDADALLAGVVDAIYAKGAPGRATVDALGLEELVIISELDDPGLRVNNGTPRAITADAELLARPDVLRVALGALLTAADRAAAEPERLQARVGADTGADHDAVGAAYRFDLRPRLDDEVLGALAEQQAFLANHGFLPRGVDVRAWADPGPLRDAVRDHIATQPERTTS